MPSPTSSSTPRSTPRVDRTQGNAVFVVLLLLLVAALALGGNYVRNYQVDQQQKKKVDSYARYGLEDLKMLAEGYRVEVAKQGAKTARRVETRNRHHFGDQVREFERVQRAASGSRDKALDLAQLRRELKKIEAELARRAATGAGMKIHLERMFRI